tara:strand:+ start:12827 stop:13645 length:819 start_codon:yes stop_codon:yes gene_type:complete
MPELPEVETTIKGLYEIKHLKILKVFIHTKQLRFKIPLSIKKNLLNSRISKIKRIAKYIILDLDNNFSLVIHLGMSGRLKLFGKNFNSEKHDHFQLTLSNGKTIIYNDPRKFGFIDIVESSNLKKRNYILSLGLDALSKKLDHKYLFSKISKSNVPIKQILLNQRVISGIGNIYASEILFHAKISPLTEGKKLTISHIMLLILSIRKILRKAIKSGGSSIRDYRSIDGTLGNFQKNFKVYNKEGKKIGKHTILKIVQYGRSTFYCAEVQNNK